ncbi:MAG: ribosomal L7Ae/L30e/S12e/Gadd45 family protein, partial [bacterium]
MLRFAHRARKLTFGMTGTANSLRKGKTRVIVLANDLAQNAENKLKPLLSQKRVPIFRCGTKKQLGDFFGRAEIGIIGIDDISFAKAIQKIYNGAAVDVFQQKKEIRARIERQRRNLTRTEVESKSSKIISLLEALPEYLSAKTIHC